MKAYYYNGKLSVRFPVTLTLQSQGIEISIEDQLNSLWNYKDIFVLETYDDRSVVLGHNANKAERLVVEQTAIKDMGKNPFALKLQKKINPFFSCKLILAAALIYIGIVVCCIHFFPKFFMAFLPVNAAQYIDELLQEAESIQKKDIHSDEHKRHFLRKITS